MYDVAFVICANGSGCCGAGVCRACACGCVRGA